MFQLVDTPIAAPGSCYLCGSATKFPFIDWGVSIEFYGALYTCSECTSAVASLLGMASREQHAKLIQENDQLAAENLDLSLQNKAMIQALPLLELVGMDAKKVHESLSIANDQPSGTVGDLDGDILADDQTTDEATRNSDELVDSGKRTSDESSNDKRVDKLHSNESKSFKLSI